MQIVVKDNSDFRNLPLLVQSISEQNNYCKIHLVLWQLSTRRIMDFRQNCNFLQPQQHSSGMLKSQAALGDSLSASA